MKRLEPHERAEILATAPDVTHADIDELEELAAERFTIDPHFPPETEFGIEEDRRSAIERRMAELAQKMFGSR